MDRPTARLHLEVQKVKSCDFYKWEKDSFRTHEIEEFLLLRHLGYIITSLDSEVGGKKSSSRKKKCISHVFSKMVDNKDIPTSLFWRSSRKALWTRRHHSGTKQHHHARQQKKLKIFAPPTLLPARRKAWGKLVVDEPESEPTSYCFT